MRSSWLQTAGLEVFNDIFRASDPRQTAVDAMRSLLYLEERVRLPAAFPSRSSNAAVGMTGTAK